MQKEINAERLVQHYTGYDVSKRENGHCRERGMVRFTI
jgi:hypothetical protein